MSLTRKLSAGVAVAATMATAAQAETTLKISHYLPAVHGIHTDFIEPWSKEVSACTDGEIKFEISPAGTQLGNVARQQEQVMAGVVDIANGLTGIPRGRFPRTSLIDMPFLTDDAGAASNALWEIYPDYLAEEYKGLKVLALYAHNGGLLHTSTKKVETMEDMKGLRIRTPSPAVSEMLSYLGADPQGLPPGEVYENPASDFVYHFLGDSNRLHLGEDNHVLFRPHEVSLSRHEVEGHHAAEVRDIRPLGATTRVTLKVEGQPELIEAEVVKDHDSLIGLARGETLFFKPKVWQKVESI